MLASFSGETRATEEKIVPILHATEGALCYIWGSDTSEERTHLQSTIAFF